MNTFKYYLRDAKEGLKRNIGAALATILLIFMSLSITGVSLLIKSSVDDVVTFLNEQVKVKVFIDPSVPVDKVKNILDKNPYVKTTYVETKEETLNKLKPMFEGKEYLFLAFEESDLPDAIVIELKNKKQVEELAKTLKKTNGITDVVYAQEFAKNILNWTNKVEQYGFIVITVFILSSFMTVAIAINLALYQRQKDIRVKLLLGAKESHVRGQFLFEGFLLGLFGSILSTFVVYFVYNNMLFQLKKNFTMFTLDETFLNITMLLIVIGGTIIGVIGSYLSTRKLIKHA